MGWEYFLLALGLMLVFEGVLPFLVPTKYKQLMAKVSSQPERSLRIMGLFSMVLGAIIIVVIHQLTGI